LACSGKREDRKGGGQGGGDSLPIVRKKRGENVK